MESKRKSYIPPDPTQIEAKPEALDYNSPVFQYNPAPSWSHPYA